MSKPKKVILIKSTRAKKPIVRSKFIVVRFTEAEFDSIKKQVVEYEYKNTGDLVRTRVLLSGIQSN